MGFWILCIAMLASACGSSGSKGPPALEEPVARINLATTSLAGCVAIPASSRIAVSDLTVSDVLGESSVAANGEFSLPVFVGGPVFVAASDSAGTTVLMGWLDSEATLLNARSTAEALVYLNSGCGMLSPEAQELAIKLIRSAPELDALQGVIAEALANSTDPLAENAVGQALQTACEYFTGLHELARRTSVAARVVVDPSTSKSGVSVLHQVGMNSIQIQNDYRRRINVYVDRVSYVPANSESSIEAEMQVREFAGPLPSVVGSTLTTFADVFQSQFAYNSSKCDPIELRLFPDDAEKTTYRVTVTGPSLGQMGEYGTLSAERKKEYQERLLESLTADLVLPVLVNVTLPLNADAMGALYDSNNTPTLIRDIAALAAVNVPAAVAKLSNGDYQGAGDDLIQALCGPSQFRLHCFNQLLQVIEQTADAKTDAAAKQVSDAVIDSLKSVDSLQARFATMLQAGHYADANATDTWLVDITSPIVRLDPAAPTVSFDGQETLQVKFSDGEPTDTVAKQLSYKFICTGNAGQIINSEQQAGPNQFETKVNWVYYLANKHVEGEDTVTVDVYRTEGGVKTRIGSATSTVKVRELAIDLRLEPVNPEVGPGSTITITAVTDPPVYDLSVYSYWWMTTNNFGKLTGTDEIQKEFHKGNSSDSYRGFLLPGSDTVFCELYKKVNGVNVRVGSASIVVTVKDVPVTQLVWQEPYAVNEHTVAAGAWFVVKKVPGALRYNFWLELHGNFWVRPPGDYENYPSGHELFDPRYGYLIHGDNGWGGWGFNFVDTREYHGHAIADDEFVVPIGSMSNTFSDPYGVEQQPGWLWGRYNATTDRAHWEQWLNIAKNWTLRYEVIMQ
jgi:hypothetical protein